MTITQHKVVSIHYSVKRADNDETIDSSENGAPMTYLHGAQNIIPGLEQALEGRSIGEEFKVTVAPEQAYGERHEDRVQQVPREAFENIGEIQVGMQVSAQTESGPIELVVTNVADKEVTVDANHPLAGVTLDFNCNVVDIRDASEEEIAHGHVHGPGGHDH